MAHNRCGRYHLGPATRVGPSAVKCHWCGKLLSLAEQLDYARTWVTMQRMLAAVQEAAKRRVGKEVK